MAIGIVAEFNPFHYGHKYLIDEAKRLYPNEEIIVVLAGNILQRGNLSIIEKYDKTKIALDNNVDLVVELPFPFATEAADFFAEGSIKILNYLKVDKIIFGSENGDIDIFYKIAETQEKDEYKELLQKYLSTGENYPTCMSKAVKDITGIEINKPNELLGLSYIRQILFNKYNIKAITIKRTNDYHSKELEEIASASSIREAFNNNINIDKYIPKEEVKYLIKDNNKYFDLLKYKIISEENLDKYFTGEEGLENRVKDVINKSKNLEELINNTKTKRYTYNRITRMLTHILFNYTKEESSNKKIKYIRVLGFNDKGKKYLSKTKKDIEVPIITNINKNNYELLKNDIMKDEIYYHIIDKDINVFESKPIKKEL